MFSLNLAPTAYAAPSNGGDERRPQEIRRLDRWFLMTTDAPVTDFIRPFPLADTLRQMELTYEIFNKYSLRDRARFNGSPATTKIDIKTIRNF